jgi:hypothetical protein
MLPYSMTSDAEYTRARMHEMKTLRRLLDEAVTTQARTRQQGPRYRLGGALIATGSRLQGITPTLPEPTLAPRASH